MMNFRDQWDEMTPKNKQILALGGGGLLLLGVISILQPVAHRRPLNLKTPALIEPYFLTRIPELWVWMLGR